MSGGEISTLSALREDFADQLAQLEERLQSVDQPLPTPGLASLLQWVFGSGGKRLRPAVVFAVARLGEADGERVLSLAAAVETLHAATLVHDDLVDGSAVRRGRPTLNTRWSAGATVLAGDWLFARASRFAAATGNVRVMEIFARTLGTMTAGELRQLFGRRGVPARQEYEFRIYAKTASLFEAAAEATAVLVLGQAQSVAALRCYGRELGMAFQIVDDILDFTGDEKRLGKPVGSDLRAGTVTLPVLLYLDRHPEAAVWLEVDGAEGAAGIEALIQAVRADQEVLDSARREAERRVEAAVAALEELPGGRARRQLLDLARFAVARDR